MACGCACCQCGCPDCGGWDVPLTPKQAKLFVPVTKDMLRELLKMPEGVDRLEPKVKPSGEG